jgi:hypothetical protein
MRSLPCSTCSKTVDLSTVKYYTADQKHVFCDAYCSHTWFEENKMVVDVVASLSRKEKKKLKKLANKQIRRAGKDDGRQATKTK